MGSLIAQEEGQARLVNSVFGETIILKADSALGKPMRLGHLRDQQGFSLVGGLVIFQQPGKEGFEE